MLAKITCYVGKLNVCRLAIKRVMLANDIKREK